MSMIMGGWVCTAWTVALHGKVERHCSRAGHEVKVGGANHWLWLGWLILNSSQLLTWIKWCKIIIIQGVYTMTYLANLVLRVYYTRHIFSRPEPFALLQAHWGSSHATLADVEGSVWGASCEDTASMLVEWWVLPTPFSTEGYLAASGGKRSQNGHRLTNKLFK